MDETRNDEEQPTEPERATEGAEPEVAGRAEPEPGAPSEAGEAEPEREASVQAEPEREVAKLSGAEMFAQLQVMASQIIDDAPPMVREAAARAAELAASAARTAGPAAQRAADIGGDAAERFADRSEHFAADLRDAAATEVVAELPDGQSDDPDEPAVAPPEADHARGARDDQEPG